MAGGGGGAARLSFELSPAWGATARSGLWQQHPTSRLASHPLCQGCDPPAQRGSRATPLARGAARHLSPAPGWPDVLAALAVRPRSALTTSGTLTAASCVFAPPTPFAPLQEGVLIVLWRRGWTAGGREPRNRVPTTPPASSSSALASWVDYRVPTTPPAPAPTHTHTPRLMNDSPLPTSGGRNGAQRQTVTGERR